MSLRFIKHLGVVFWLGLMSCLALPSIAAAQDDRTEPVLTDPITGERYLEVRPSDPLQRGRWAVAPWTIYAVGGAALLGGVWVLARRTRRSRNARGPKEH